MEDDEQSNEHEKHFFISWTKFRSQALSDLQAAEDTGSVNEHVWAPMNGPTDSPAE